MQDASRIASDDRPFAINNPVVEESNPRGRPQTDDPSLPDFFPHHNGANFLTPTELTVSPLAPRRAVMIGSCLLDEWGFHRRNPSGCPVDHILVTNADQMPENPDAPINSYDFAVVQVPLRPIYHDTTYAALDHGSPEAFEQAFQQSCDRLAAHLQFRMQWNIEHGLLTFVANFLPTQRNPMGVLFPRFDRAIRSTTSPSLTSIWRRWSGRIAMRMCWTSTVSRAQSGAGGCKTTLSHNRHTARSPRRRR